MMMIMMGMGMMMKNKEMVIDNEISPLHLQCTDHGREEDGEVMMMKGLIWVKNVREYVWICKKKFRHENKPNQRHLRLPLIF